MRIALIAHDNRKQDMLKYVAEHKSAFEGHELFATGTTGKLIAEHTGLQIHCFLSGPLGGDQQIGSLVATGQLDMVIFLRDPLTAMPHEPDVQGLLRLCDVRDIPVATNLGSARMFADDLMRLKNVK
ncbi:methylglyoxal synthase [Symbiobacterium terraclitae]|uniref:Methylglyoxal synthase n=1 Tax=Symbiobacterium terraclitae TaxID=557451 RepID=A0ABS4JMX1_9FIRM|nr:methylglyoxal synthase [Symbiobacterium terraclitae]MBP2016885.1 methylglyoxal synthase [Symbiobacterium terraclitae]